MAYQQHTRLTSEKLAKQGGEGLIQLDIESPIINHRPG
jgi:hypothetical protein